eukprot:386665-Pleurochrysis_carterae.AAC.1
MPLAGCKKIMHGMDIIDDEKLCEAREGTGIPPLHRNTRTKIGRGANNEVILLIHKEDDAKFILRMPLRDADTRNWEDARMEARYTLLASRRGVSPEIKDMWFVRRSSKSTAQRRGLNMIMEHFTTNLSRLIRYEPEEVLKHASCMQQTHYQESHHELPFSTPPRASYPGSSISARHS